ncbi:ATP-binding protein [Streptomyces zhihengii]|uniref:ATP-binding protein n=1 Tax=Streptomyces zhihengii TaxID=1818004 RepID=A0ABS2UMS7_9ACTN|nr:ATP-binding protein [Streptomyces zhihengii]MBM9618015.1 ATP-binding protein [Streptomyces zhihengii]
MPRTTTRVRPTGPPGYSRTLRREPESAASARRLVRTALSAWGLADLADGAALIVSELVSNAVRHGRRESIRVFVERPGPSRVRVGVVDFSHRLPRRGECEARSEGGRGLAIVEALAENWGVERLSWGKRVWAELAGA